jgi:hypothetical protein
MIVIPMAGLSRRFTLAGYALPKYMLPVGDDTVFAHAVRSFDSLFATTPFLFIARDVADTRTFLDRECKALGIADVRIAMLDRETAGQADTVELGLDQAGIADDEAVTIFNIDTFRARFAFPDAAWFAASDGYLEVFRGSGANWSYVGPADGEDEPLVARTTEKQPISDLCCDGLYHFRRAGDFRSALAAERRAPTLAELYVAPLYNHLIRSGARVHYDIVQSDAITFCGVPAEYDAVLASLPKR